MGNPCEICIVHPICKSGCEKLVEYTRCHSEIMNEDKYMDRYIAYSSKNIFTNFGGIVCGRKHRLQSD